MGKIGNGNAGSPPKKADDMGRSVAHRLSGTERKEGLYIVSIFLEFLGFLKQHLATPFFCKETSTEKRQFCFGIAKAALLQHKTYAFTVQNSRFWNAKQ